MARRTRFEEKARKPGEGDGLETGTLPCLDQVVEIHVAREVLIPR